MMTLSCLWYLRDFLSFRNGFELSCPSKQDVVCVVFHSLLCDL